VNDILPIVLSILAALVVIGALIPVLIKTRRNITRYPETRDANDPEVRSGGGTAVEDSTGTIERGGPAGVRRPRGRRIGAGQGRAGRPNRAGRL